MKTIERLDTYRDPRNLTFSQAQGYEEIPGPLKLEQLPPKARIQIWNVFYRFIDATKKFDLYRNVYVGGVWEQILRAKHASHDNRPLDEWNDSFEYQRRQLRDAVQSLRFNQVFDLIQFVMCHPQCSKEFVGQMKEAFMSSKLAYTIDVAEPPTIIPAVTEAEGDSIIEAMQTLRKAGLDSSASHLREASECVNRGDWAGSIRESIHAVESVARQLAPKASGTLGPAMASLEKRQTLHPALKEAFSKLYGYTSDEQGIRHALLDKPSANVGMDEAVFMLGACASFASYLWRKHAAGATL